MGRPLDAPGSTRMMTVPALKRHGPDGDPATFEEFDAAIAVGAEVQVFADDPDPAGISQFALVSAPPPPREGTAGALLAALPVQPESGGYDRDLLFGDWIDAHADTGCDTRSEVLQHDSLVPVTFSSGCTVAPGQWQSYYDGASCQLDAGRATLTLITWCRSPRRGVRRSSRCLAS